jgi:hypothetical protein
VQDIQAFSLNECSRLNKCLVLSTGGRSTHVTTRHNEELLGIATYFNFFPVKGTMKGISQSEMGTMFTVMQFVI